MARARSTTRSSGRASKATSSAKATSSSKTTSRKAESNGKELAYKPADLLKEAKKDIGHTEAAKNLGVSLGQLSMLAWCIAMVEVGRYSTVPATTASVKKLKDVERNRWELIAARTGESLTRVRELYGTPDEVAAAAVRGRGDGGSKSSTKKSTAKRGGKTATAASPRRSRTRAERQAARSSNPS